MKHFANHSRKALTEFCELITCCGVIDWSRAKCTFGKIFWLNIIIPGLIVTFYQIEYVVRGYINEKKYTSSVSLLTTSSIPFPNVTICNFNRASAYNMVNSGITADALSYAYGSLPVSYDMPILNMKASEQAWQELIDRNSTLADLKKLFSVVGYSCVQTFIRCSWGGVSFSCCDYVTEVINAYGKCFILSPPRTDGSQYPMQAVPGVTRGVKLALMANLQGYSSNVLYNNFMEEGFMISSGYVHEPSFPDPVAVNVGVHALISLSVKKEIFTKPTFQVYKMPCRENAELMILNESYTKLNCIFDCKLKNYVDVCACIPFTNSKQNYTTCNGTMMPDCYDTIKTSPSAIINCVENCMSPCADSMMVSSAVSYASFPATSLRSSVVKVLDLTDEILTSVAVVDIYFPRLEIIVIETTESTSIFTFISNFGGQLGLVLGMSVVTCIQFYYYLCCWLCGTKTKLEQKRRIKTVVIKRTKQ